MFCMNCGKQMPDGAKFCMNCGTPIGQLATVNVDEKKDSNQILSTGSHAVEEIDRAALKIHLENLVTLEFAKIALQNKAAELKAYVKKNDHFAKIYNTKYPFCFYYDGHDICIPVGFAPDMDASLKGAFNGYLKAFEAAAAGKNDVDLLVDFPYLVPYPIDKEYTVNGRSLRNIQLLPVTDFANEKKRFFKLYKRGINEESVVKYEFEKAYKDFKSICEEEYRKVGESLSGYRTQISICGTKEHEQGEKLAEAYSLNIIPVQFRNVYAISYINDFISTSNEPLSSVLMHYNLETVKQKLDGILQQQSQIIMQNAYQLTQNQRIIQQNNQLLNRLASIEANSSRAAEYGRIAAVNTDTMAWIQTLDFLF